MADTPKEPISPEFLNHFGRMDDPRQAGKILYPLNEIFLLVLCAVISGADGWTSIALYGCKKISLLRRFLPYEHGTPRALPSCLRYPHDVYVTHADSIINASP